MESKEQAAKSEQETVEKTEKCEQAKKRLASYQRPRVNIKQADGSLRSIPEDKRQAEIKKSEDYIKKLCN